MDHFWQLAGGGPTGKAATKINASKHGPRPLGAVQGANRNVPQEEMLLSMAHG